MTPRLPLLLAVLLFLAAPLRAQSAIQDTPPVPAELRQALLAGETATALGMLDKLQAEAGEDAHFWAYLRGVVLEQQGNDRAALDAYQAFARDYPESAWRRKAAFRQADAYARLGEWQAAEALIAAEVGALRGGERQAALAQVYLERADELSAEREGSASLEARDLERALVLYRQALELDLPAELRSDVMLRIAWCEMERQGWNVAEAAYAAYLERRPGDEQAALDRGECLLQLGRHLEARQLLEDLAARSEDAEVQGLARFMVGRAFGERAEERRLAVGAFRRYLEAHPRHRKSSAARFNIGLLLDRAGDLRESIEAYEAFLIAPAPETEDLAALEQDAELRRRTLMEMAGVQAKLGEHAAAAATYGRYVTLYPDGPEWAQAQEGMVSQEYAVGTAALQDKRWDEARTSFSRFAAAHPLDQRSRQAAFTLGDIDRREAKEMEQDDPRRGDLQRSAIQQWGRLADKFPGTDVASHALYASGMVQEFDLRDVEAAVGLYRRCDFGDYAHQARMRLAEMVEPSLEVHTPRSWRSDEAARLVADLRNVEEVQVQVYALDLETYFRKELRIEGVADLDLDLIAADLSFDYRVEDFERYRPLQAEIALPVEGPGVWAVAVSTEDKRATTLVVRSDLDVVVKASAVDLLVFAEDLRTMQPVPGAEVIVAFPRGGADGLPRLVEFSCGEDGVGRLDLEGLDLEDASDPSLLVRDARGLAATAVGTSWLSAPRGLQPLGVLDTDRSVYPPGATVSWRAVLRESEGGAWTFEPGRPYLVQWREPGGRLLWQEQVQLDAFGTLNGTRVLDPEAPLGGYQILVRDRDRELVRRNFLVQRIELQQVDLSLDAERGVYYRGESVDLRFEARRFYGSPLADAPVRLSTPDGRWHDLRTDADGVVEFSFDTRLMTRSGRLAFVASLPQEGMEVDFSAVLAATGYRARLGLDQEVPLAGRGVRVELSTTLADGTPAARGMQWELQRAGDSGNYRPVEGIGGAVATDDTGLEVWTWTPERGGWYRLRAMGEDRFGNPVVARRDVFVSGDDDPQKLRLLAEAEDLAVGGALAVELINRAGPGLALVTIEGGRILEHHLRELPSGVSTLELPVSGAWFPNVAVAVTMMDGNELHQASRDFRVQRGLEITMSAREGVVLPGQEAVIDLEVRDQLGRPVAASLSLSAVDASLLAQYPTGLVDLRRLPTSLAWREAALQTSSSCWFRYQGQTVQLAEELLQELELQSAAQAWAEGRDQAREGLAYALPPSAPTTPGTVAGVRGRFAADADEDFLGQVEEEMELSELGYLDSISIGGGAGGKSGGRGGVASRKARPMTQEEVLGPDSSLAYWNAAVETGADGKATVRFRMPQRSTRWQLDCRGVAVDGALGQARMELVSRAPFFVDLRTPARLLEGDRPAFLATVTNLSGEAGDVQLELFVDAGSSQQVKQAVAVPAEGEVQVLLHLPEALQVLADDEARVSVVATAFLGADGEEPQELQARFTRNLPMVPWGLPRMVRESGVLAGAGALVELALPPGSYGPDTRLTIEFGSSVDVALLREATRGAIGIGRLSTFGGRVLPPDHSVAGLASALSGRLAAAAHVADSVASGVELGDPAHLRSLASRDLSLLLARQRSDGGWAWSGDRRESLAESTAIATAALEDARTAGLDVPQGAIDKARGFLKQALPTRSRDGETTAMVLHALALSGNADFGVANRLHRDHRQLSPAGMAYLARALKALDSAPMAEEVVTTLLARRQGPAGAPWPAPWGDAGGSGWCGSGVAMDALALLAVVEVMPGDPAAATLEQALWEQLPWPQGGPHGLAVSALAAARAGQAQALDARVTVSVGDREPNEYLLEDGTRMSLTVPLEGITSESVRLDVSGRGAPAYVVSLEGFDSAPQPQQNGGLSFSMVNMLAPAPSYAGRAIQTGFGVTTGFEGWRNTVGSLDYGAVSTLEIHYRTDRDLPRREVNQDFLVLEVPLPAGAQVVESGLRGDYLDWQQLDGVAVFTLGRPERAGSLRIPLRGLVPGSYRMLPPVLADAYDPSHAAIAEAATLTVLDPGVARSDEYRATPDELYHTGIAAFDAGDRETAWSSLRALDELAGDALRADPMRESTRRLLTMALDRADADAAVRAFEVIKERFPAVIIGFDEIAAVAASYRELEEFERAARIHLAIAGETFGKDLKVAGVLEQQEDFHGAGELMLRLWQEYPDFPSVVETGLTLADRMLQKAPAAHTDVSLREARRDRAVLLFEAVQHLRHFLVLYPTDPLAGDAALNLVSAFLDLEDYDTAAALGAEMVERFPAPRLKDAFGYTQAVAEWYRGDDAAAERLLGGIADAAYEQPDGSMQPSENRDLALYILAQIHHARQDFVGASTYYDRVDQVFSDAAQVLAGFRRRALAMDEIVEVRPGETAMVPLHYRNLDEVELLVYPVDLMTLYLRERSLSGITQVKLAGIRPLVERTVSLDDDGSMRAQDAEVALDLAESGAYLVICRAGSLHASGMVLVSDMELEVATSPSQGQVRVQAISRGDGAYLDAVEVRVIGSQGGSLIRGKTDRRGLFSSDGVNGAATVIARFGERDYAFYRGEPVAAAGLGDLMDQLPAEILDSEAYFENVRGFNDLRQDTRAKKLQRQQEGVYLGVSVDKVK